MKKIIPFSSLAVAFAVFVTNSDVLGAPPRAPSPVFSGMTADDLVMLIPEESDSGEYVLVRYDPRTNTFPIPLVEFVVPAEKVLVLTDIDIAGGEVVGIKGPTGALNFFLPNYMEKSFSGGLIIGPGATVGITGEPFGVLLGHLVPLE